MKALKVKIPSRGSKACPAKGFLKGEPNVEEIGQKDNTWFVWKYVRSPVRLQNEMLGGESGSVFEQSRVPQ